MSDKYLSPVNQESGTTLQVEQLGIEFPSGEVIWAEPGAQSIPVADKFRGVFSMINATQQSQIVLAGVNVGNDHGFPAFVKKWQSAIKQAGGYSENLAPQLVRRTIIITTTQAEAI